MRSIVVPRKIDEGICMCITKTNKSREQNIGACSTSSVRKRVIIV